MFEFSIILRKLEANVYLQIKYLQSTKHFLLFFSSKNNVSLCNIPDRITRHVKFNNTSGFAKTLWKLEVTIIT